MSSNYVVVYDGEEKGQKFFYTEQEALRYINELKDCTYIVYNIKKKKMIDYRINLRTGYDYFVKMYKDLSKLS